MSRYFRFGLRTILIVTAIAAALFAWLGRDIIRARREKPIIDRILSEGGMICFEGDLVPPMDNFSTVRWEKPNFLQRQFGMHYGAYVEDVSLFSEMGNPTDETIQGLGRFERLRKVWLHGRGFTDKCVDELLQLKHLKLLSLGNTLISAAGVKRLSKCSELESMILYDASDVFGDEGPREFGNAHFESLSEFPVLRHLTIGGESLTDEGFAHVGKCRDLTELTINGATVTDNAFEYLTNLQQLQSLDVSNLVVSDKSLLQIGKLRRLKVLELDSTSITDEGLANLKSLSQLNELTLYRCTIDGSGFAAISSLKHLQRLCVTSIELNDDGIAAISCLPGLMELEMSETKVTGKGLQQLERAKQLRRLSISITDKLTLDDAKALKVKLPNCQIDWVERDPVTGNVNIGAL